MASSCDWVDLGKGLKAYYGQPEGAGPHPCIVVFIEAFGVNDHFKQLTRRLADEGFATITPDIYDSELYAYDDIDGAISKLKTLDDDTVMKQTEQCLDWLADRAQASEAEAIAGMEARGFIFGASVASKLGLPFLPIRKPGKLPCETIGIDYALEYGADRLEMDPTTVDRDQKVAIVDDLLATGGTACATAQLLREAGARVADAIFVIDLPDLGGAEKLKDRGIAVAALMQFEGD